MHPHPHSHSLQYRESYTPRAYSRLNPQHLPTRLSSLDYRYKKCSKTIKSNETYLSKYDSQEELKEKERNRADKELRDLLLKESPFKRSHLIPKNSISQVFQAQSSGIMSTRPIPAYRSTPYSSALPPIFPREQKNTLKLSNLLSKYRQELNQTSESKIQGSMPGGSMIKSIDQARREVKKESQSMQGIFYGSIPIESEEVIQNQSKFVMFPDVIVVKGRIFDRIYL